ncbi:hypothetical protein ABAC460_07060 [Asticcacaulis sp. AC460]|uniref:GNAT family N-acetyltransferase n=1 Tax=Asticcacaulis sp. AC460 TaxID=1282360 RepID=UPI0003C3D9B0|nr:GNAT family N-acetyltransferase [Asticcacaulis sp. AC460]ESQ91319.1 hypothetical protein ABAC460_07060 [Asticcacaulis sp. AC460]
MHLNNARVRMDTVDLAGRPLDVVVPQTPNGCWQTSLSVLLGPVAREEARRALSGPELWAVLALSHATEAFGRLLRIDRAVYPGHQLLSTNLYDGRLDQIIAAVPDLARAYPDRAIILRSLTQRPQTGVAWPIRVVWIIDDMPDIWAKRRDSRRDMRKLAESNLTARCFGPQIDDVRLDRCLALYRRLYIETYSAFNPDYTAAGLRDLLARGIIEIWTLESDDGDIAAFCAARDDGETLTIPLVGYDRSRPQDDGLYRAIMAHMAQQAMERRLKRNLSAGAPHFKRHRGASPWMEYLVIFDSHLPVWRRMAYRLIGAMLSRFEARLMAAAVT